jgi:hypothetical protein
MRARLRRRKGGEHTGDSVRSGRRVLYGSTAAGLTRILVGLILLAGALYWSLPVLASEDPPPAPTGLFIGLNDRSAGRLNPPGSFLSVYVGANGCSNPVLVTGTLERPARRWAQDERESRHGTSIPSRVAITLSGATFVWASANLGRSTGAPELQFNGSGEIASEKVRTNYPRPRTATVPTRISGVLPADPSGGFEGSGLMFSSPQWLSVRTPLSFELEANLAHPLGFHRCYIDVPQLIAPDLNSTSAAPVFDAETLAQQIFARNLVLQPIPQGGEVVAAQVDVSVRGEIPDAASIGTGGILTTLAGADEHGSFTSYAIQYTCQIAVSKPPPNLEASMFASRFGRTTFDANTAPTCGGVPVFEVSGVGGDATKRLFIAGILGALAATVLIEVLFLGERDGSGGLWWWPRRRGKPTGRPS